MQSPIVATMLVLGVTLVVLLVPAVVAILLYNRLVALRVESDAAWADIDVQLKRRHDLIPNLVETVKGYAAHERATLESVTAARAKAVESSTAAPAARAGAESGLSDALSRLFALSEGYPELRAAEPFQELQRNLADVENDLQQARRYYNAVVRDLNTAIHQFPSSIVARAARFRDREYFEIEVSAERARPEVGF